MGSLRHSQEFNWVAGFSPGSMWSDGGAASVDPATGVLFTVFFRCSFSQGHRFTGRLGDLLVVRVGQVEQDPPGLLRMMLATAAIAASSKGFWVRLDVTSAAT